jgi:hypothetical protein
MQEPTDLDLDLLAIAIGRVEAVTPRISDKISNVACGHTLHATIVTQNKAIIPRVVKCRAYHKRERGLRFKTQRGKIDIVRPIS